MTATDELRDCIRTANRSYEDVRNPYNDREILHIPEDELLAIVDRIDAEHERMCEDLTIGMEPMTEENMARNGWVKLPVDADGVPIHVGDRVENNERVVRIVLTDGSWEPSVYVEKLPNFLHEYFCHEVSHYQPDSWERIIEDAVKNGMYDHDNERIQQKPVERCRRLAGEE